MEARISEVFRKTSETEITLKLNIDGQGKTNISTGIGFFDHMLNAFARHGLFDLELNVKGDLEVDSHHTIEDTGIVLGQGIAKALGDKSGITRYGHFLLPMDEALSLCAIDLSGRSFFVWDCEFTTEDIGGLKSEMVKEFFYALASNCDMNLHLKMLDGTNAHHMAEALFKSFGRSLSMAVAPHPRMSGVWSTKGSL